LAKPFRQFFVFVIEYTSETLNPPQPGRAGLRNLRTTCITVRHASVMLPWRDMASAMCRVTTGSTSFDDCRWQSFDAAAIA